MTTIFAFASALILILLNISPTNMSFFFLCYTWHFALLYPGAREKALQRKFQLSLLGVAHRFNRYFLMLIPTEGRWSRLKKALVRSLLPMVLIVFLRWLGAEGNLAFGLLGSMAIEAALAWPNFFKK